MFDKYPEGKTIEDAEKYVVPVFQKGMDFITAGNYSTTLTSTGVTNITLPTTGTIATLAGTETLTSKTVVDAILTGVPTAPTAAPGTSTTQSGLDLSINAKKTKLLFHFNDWFLAGETQADGLHKATLGCVDALVHGGKHRIVQVSPYRVVAHHGTLVLVRAHAGHAVSKCGSHLRVFVSEGFGKFALFYNNSKLIPPD